MRKIFLTGLLLFLSLNLCANAYQINYNPAGGITSTQYTAPFGGPTFVNNFPASTMNNYGSNALFSPTTSRRIAEKQRQIKNEQTYLENTKNINVNINHTGVNPYYGYNRYNNYNNYNNYNPVPRYYNNNGVRYYNNGGFNGFNTRGLTIY